MIINAVRITETGIDIKHIKFSELIAALEPGNTDSYDKIFNNLKF